MAPLQIDPPWVAGVGDDMDALLVEDSFNKQVGVLGGRPLAESSPHPAGGDAAVKVRQYTVADVGQLVQDEDLHDMRRRLATRAFTSLGDLVARAPGWLRRLATKMVKERMEARAVELGGDMALADSELTAGLTYLICICICMCDVT